MKGSPSSSEKGRGRQKEGRRYTQEIPGERGLRGGNETEMAIPVPPSETRMSKQKNDVEFRYDWRAYTERGRVQGGKIHLRERREGEKRFVPRKFYYGLSGRGG